MRLALLALAACALAAPSLCFAQITVNGVKNYQNPLIRNVVPAGQKIGFRAQLLAQKGSVNGHLTIWDVAELDRPFGSLCRDKSDDPDGDEYRIENSEMAGEGTCVGEECVLEKAATSPEKAEKSSSDNNGRWVAGGTKFAKTVHLRWDDEALAAAAGSGVDVENLRVIRDVVASNGTLSLQWVVFVVPRKRTSPVFTGSAQLTEYRRRDRIRTPRFLLTESADSDADHAMQARSDELLPVLPSKIELNFVEDVREYSPQEAESFEPFVKHWTRLSIHQHIYTPVTHIGTKTVLEQRVIPLNASLNGVDLELTFVPRTRENWQWMMQMEASLQLQMDQFGSTEREIEQVKAMLMDSSQFLLYLTGGVAFLHLLLDFLAFKNDVSFWRGRKTLRGVSVSALFFNAVSQFVILLYLLENDTSRLVIGSLVVSLIIELWKIARSVTWSFSFRGGLPRFSFHEDNAMRDAVTMAADHYAMRVVIVVLLPVSILYSVYTLFFHQHFSWYSWLISSLSGVVYGLGFVRMMPQLFINYKLKSVAYMPWRAFTYKFLNTVIDDLFAFVIIMPTMHRVAVFRDDLIFLVYLFQLWKYPVDKTRVNEFGQTGEEEKDASSAVADGKTESDQLSSQYRPVSEITGNEVKVGFPLLAVAADPRSTGPRGGTDGWEPWRFATGGGGGSAKTGVSNQLLCVDAHSPSRLREFASFDAGAHCVRCIAFHPSDDQLAVGTGSFVHIMDLERDAVLTPRETTKADFSEVEEDREVKCLSYLRDGDSLITGGADGFIRVWDSRTLQEQASAKDAGASDAQSTSSRALASSVDSLFMSPDDKFIYVGSKAGLVAWSIEEDGSRVVSLRRAGSVPLLHREFHKIPVIARGVCAADDGGRSWLFTGEIAPGRRSWLVKWSVSVVNDEWKAERATWRVAYRNTHHNALSVSPNARLLATCTSDGVVTLHRTNYLHAVMTVQPHGFFITSLAFSPDSRSVVSAGADDAVYCTPVREERSLPAEWYVAAGFALLVLVVAVFLLQ